MLSHFSWTCAEWKSYFSVILWFCQFFSRYKNSGKSWIFPPFWIHFAYLTQTICNSYGSCSPKWVTHWSLKFLTRLITVFPFSSNWDKCSKQSLVNTENGSIWREMICDDWSKKISAFPWREFNVAHLLFNPVGLRNSWNVSSLLFCRLCWYGYLL